MSTLTLLNEKNYRLTDLIGVLHPNVCQSCGGSSIPGFGNGLMRHSLTRWQECDHRDQKENRLVVLCDKCSKRVIKPHPRLYHELTSNAPWPGCMAICVQCKLREGLTCTSPDAKANGGQGVMLTTQKPYTAMVDGTKYRGPMVLWPSPPSDCKQCVELVDGL
jgi:hypothetical protein